MHKKVHTGCSIKFQIRTKIRTRISFKTRLKMNFSADRELQFQAIKVTNDKKKMTKLSKNDKIDQN